MDDEELTNELLNEFDTPAETEDLPNEPSENENNDDVRINICNATGFFLLMFTWIEGLRKGSRLIWVPNEECIFYSNAINQKDGAIACTCYIKGCKERIFIRNDGSAIRKTTPNHNHGSLYTV